MAKILRGYLEVELVCVRPCSVWLLSRPLSFERDTRVKAMITDMGIQFWNVIGRCYSPPYKLSDVAGHFEIVGGVNDEGLHRS